MGVGSDSEERRARFGSAFYAFRVMLVKGYRLADLLLGKRQGFCASRMQT